MKGYKSFMLKKKKKCQEQNGSLLKLNIKSLAEVTDL